MPSGGVCGPFAVRFPAGTGQVAAHDGFDRQRVGSAAEQGATAQLRLQRRVDIDANCAQAVGDAGVVRRNQVVRQDVGELLEPENGKRGQDTAFVGNRLRQDDIEGGDTIGGDKQNLVVAYRVDVTYFSGRETRQAGNVGGKDNRESGGEVGGAQGFITFPTISSVLRGPKSRESIELS